MVVDTNTCPDIDYTDANGNPFVQGQIHFSPTSQEVYEVKSIDPDYLTLKYQDQQVPLHYHAVHTFKLTPVDENFVANLASSLRQKASKLEEMLDQRLTPDSPKKTEIIL